MAAIQGATQQKAKAHFLVSPVAYTTRQLVYFRSRAMPRAISIRPLALGRSLQPPRMRIRLPVLGRSSAIAPARPTPPKGSKRFLQIEPVRAIQRLARRRFFSIMETLLTTRRLITLLLETMRSSAIRRATVI